MAYHYDQSNGHSASRVYRVESLTVAFDSVHIGDSCDPIRSSDPDE